MNHASIQKIHAKYAFYPNHLENQLGVLVMLEETPDEDPCFRNSEKSKREVGYNQTGLNSTFATVCSEDIPESWIRKTHFFREEYKNAQATVKCDIPLLLTCTL